jgi:hypothetical protein
MVENRWKAPLELPRRKEKGPIDIGHELREVDIDAARTGEGRHSRIEVELQSIAARVRIRQRRTLVTSGVLVTKAGLLVACVLREHRSLFWIHQARDDVHDPRCIGNVHDSLLVLGGNFDRRMLAARRCASDQKRQREAAMLHLLGDIDHLVKRRRDEPAQSDHVDLAIERLLKNAIARHHDAKVDDLVAIAAEHDTDDVLANVVHVTLHGGHHNLALGPGARSRRCLFGLHEWLQPGHRSLHGAGALHHLRQEHLAGPEQVADDFHAVHERPFDH